MNRPNFTETPRNMEQKLPCILVLDTSGSMDGRIEELKQGLRDMQSSILDDEIASDRVELAIVEFNDSAQVLSTFKMIDEFTIPSFVAGGLTNYVASINEAIRIIDDRKAYYKRTNQNYYRPYIILITDGAPTNSDEELVQLNNNLFNLSEGKHITFWSFGIDDADMGILQNLSNRMNKPLKIKSDSFRQFFKWLSNSFQIVSKSFDGDKLDLRPESMGMKSPFDYVV